MKTRILSLCAIALAWTALFQGSVRAAEPDPDAERPWAKGVAQADQDAAIELFTEGTRLLKDAFFTKAVDLYKQALSRWDHPAIHFNLAKALMNLEKPVEAYKHLEGSLKFGGRPLDDDQIEQAKRYKKLLYETELAEIEVTCQEPGAVVTINGEPAFTAPGQWSGVVKPDNVTVLASKDGFQTKQEKPELVPGQKLAILLELLPIEDSVKYTHAMPVAIPWVVLGSGVLLAAGGGVASWQSSSAYQDYDKAIAQCTADTALPILDDNGQDTGGRLAGCFPTQSIKDKKSTGDLMKTLSLVGYFTGGAVAATGVVLLIINRARPVRVEGTVAPVSVTPYVGPDGAGVSATFGF